MQLPGLLALSLLTLALGRLAIETAFLELNKKTLALTKLLELPQGLLKTVPIGYSDFDHCDSPTFVCCIFILA